MVLAVPNSGRSKARQLPTHTDNSGEFWFVRDAGMRARRQTGSDWSHTQHQQSTVGHRYVNTRSWLRTHCHTRTSTITDLLLHHHSKSVTYVRSCSFLSRAFYTIPNPCVNEWVSECSDGRIADAIRHVSMWRKDPNRIIKSLARKEKLVFVCCNRIKCRVDFSHSPDY
jgi:hypothetical protein